MTGQQFADDDEELKKVAPKWLCTLPKIFNSDAFQKACRPMGKLH